MNGGYLIIDDLNTEPPTPEQIEAMNKFSATFAELSKTDAPVRVGTINGSPFLITNPFPQ